MELSTLEDAVKVTEEQKRQENIQEVVKLKNSGFSLDDIFGTTEGFKQTEEFKNFIQVHHTNTEYLISDDDVTDISERPKVTHKFLEWLPN